MENPFPISFLNDFVFCPASIYFHMVDADINKLSYESKEQQEGSALHENPDHQQYSTRKDILQGVAVYCEQYNLNGKIDIFDISSGTLTERKRHITTIYDGYHFQIYAYCFALRERGYSVQKLQFHSMIDNKTYSVPLPEDNPIMTEKFIKTVEALQSLHLDSFLQTNPLKCAKCVYEPLCSFSAREKKL